MLRHFLHDFREFAIKGNVLDLAVGVVIGGAFGKIVTSTVNDLLMPVIALTSGGINFTDHKLVLKSATVDAAGQTVAPLTLNYGNFIQTSVDFLIIAFCIFMLIKAINTLRRPSPAHSPADPPDIQLLAEIRDLLKERQKV